MGDAKNIIVKPISSKDANRLIKKIHYSGKVVVNSQLHFGVFMNGKCGGAMQFGPSLDKRKMLGIVSGTLWNEFLELNRLAFADWLPRNSESRAISYAMKFIKKKYPWIKWVISFADGTQCGDGTIYRASGFYLIGIKKNTSIWEAPSGLTFTDIGVRTGSNCYSNKILGIFSSTTTTKGKYITDSGRSSMKKYKAAGCKPKDGFHLRYIFFLDSTAKDRLTVPILPFSEIDNRGAGMYKGIKRPKQAMASAQEAQRGGGTHLDAPLLNEKPQK